jgi:hypothetical protein
LSRQVTVNREMMIGNTKIKWIDPLGYNNPFYPYGTRLSKKERRRRKRQERLESCSGLLAKERSLKKSLKRYYKLLDRSVPPARYVPTLLDSPPDPSISAMYYPKDPTLNLGYGRLTSGSAAHRATLGGIMLPEKNYNEIRAFGQSFTLKPSSNDFITPSS